MLILLILYLSQPVVVAEFEQTREEDFTFSRPHKLLPLPHILLQQILLTQLSLPLRLCCTLLNCGKKIVMFFIMQSSLLY